MMPDTPQSTLARMEAMLGHCRRSIVLAAVSARLRTGLQSGLRGLLVIATSFLVLRALAWFIGTPFPGVALVLIVVAIFWALVLVHALVSGIRGAADHPSLAAERLDLSQATHNRIATAIGLLRSGDDSPFAREAIRDGWEHLERLQAGKPHVDVPPVSWRRAGFSFAAAVVMLIVGLFLIPKPGVLGTGQEADVIAATETISPPGSSEIEDGDSAEDRRLDRAKSTPKEPAAMKPEKTAEAEQGKRPEPGSESRSEGAMAKHAAGESRSSQAASNSSSAASGEGAKSEPGDSEPGKPPKPRDSKQQTAGQPKAEPKEEKKGGSIDARGSSGAGSMQTSQNEWSSNVKAKADDNDDFQEEEELDEEMDPDKLRLGAQPALKNRAAQVSRELSLFTGAEVANQQNRGRGGPGGQKKARGTATMIMGVPIPGFVRGRLLPGPTKSTQEEVEPSPVQGKYAAATDLPQANPEEEPQERFHPTAADSARARDYLLNYHSQNNHPLQGTDDNK